MFFLEDFFSLFQVDLTFLGYTLETRCGSLALYNRSKQAVI